MPSEAKSREQAKDRHTNAPRERYKTSVLKSRLRLLNEAVQSRKKFTERRKKKYNPTQI